MSAQSFSQVWALSATLTALSLVLLAGCDPLDQADAPLAVQQVDGVFRLAVCTDLELDSILVEEREPGESDWTTVWDAKGDIPIETGSVLGSDEPPQSATVGTWSTLRDVVGDSVSVSLVSGQSSVTADFVIGKGGLPFDTWLHPDGRFTPTPCADAKA